MNLSRYVNMLRTANFRDDLDIVSPVYNAPAEVPIPKPIMDLKIFDPYNELGAIGYHNSPQE